MYSKEGLKDMEKKELDMILEEMQKIVPDADFDGWEFEDNTGYVIDSDIQTLFKDDIERIKSLMNNHSLILNSLNIIHTRLYSGLQFGFVKRD